MKRDPGSYRDPSGYVFHDNDAIFRAIMPHGEKYWESIRHSSFIADLARNGKLIDFIEVDRDKWPKINDTKNIAALVRHPKLRFISYPYEWPFEALRDAAIAHVDIHKKLLEHEFNLADGSAYNIQFIGTKPIFIDLLSIRPYNEGEYWIAQDQFLRQFVNPLVFEAYTGVGFDALYRAKIEGIPVTELAALLPFYTRFKPSLQFSVFLPAYFTARSISSRKINKINKKKLKPLPKDTYIQMLHQMKKIVKQLTPKRNQTVWSEYGIMTSYTEIGQQEKEAFVRDYVRKIKPELLIDIGCNNGSYSEAAFKAGARSIIGLEMDRTALDYAYLRAKEKGYTFYAICVDLANPSPSQGWRNQERKGLSTRLHEAKADGLLALAVTHHMIIGRNLPMNEVIEELTSYADTGVIEFVPKTDPKVQELLQHREDIFHDYNEESFRSVLKQKAHIITEHKISESDRILFWYERIK